MCLLGKLHALCLSMHPLIKESSACTSGCVKPLSCVYPTGSTQLVSSWVCSSFMTIRLCIGAYFYCLYIWDVLYNRDMTSLSFNNNEYLA